MIVSLNRGTPTQSIKYYKLYYRDTQKGTRNSGKPPKKLTAWDLAMHILRWECVKVMPGQVL